MGKKRYSKKQLQAWKMNKHLGWKLSEINKLGEPKRKRFKQVGRSVTVMRNKR